MLLKHPFLEYNCKSRNKKARHNKICTISPNFTILFSLYLRSKDWDAEIIVE